MKHEVTREIKGQVSQIVEATSEAEAIEKANSLGEWEVDYWETVDEKKQNRRRLSKMTEEQIKEAIVQNKQTIDDEMSNAQKFMSAVIRKLALQKMLDENMKWEDNVFRLGHCTNDDFLAFIVEVRLKLND